MPQKDVFTRADGDEGLEELNAALCGTVLHVLDWGGKIVLCYDGGRMLAIYEEDGVCVFQDVIAGEA